MQTLLPAELWNRLETVYRTAEEKEALYTIHTRPETLQDSTLGLRFQLQVSEALRDKPKASSQSKDKKPEDVFASHDEDLSVEESLGPSHKLRLNKFNVVPFHSLVITRQFEKQTDDLTEADWEATSTAMQAYPDGALVYYNGGENSGSSQPRKHLQILPLRVNGSECAPLPLEAVAQDAWKSGSQRHCIPLELRKLPFQSFAASISDSASPADLQKAYRGLMNARSEATKQAHYNVLLTKNWMLLVPRKQESYGPVSCNALVFAGTLLVRSTYELEFIRQEGPMQILKEVSFPWER